MAPSEIFPDNRGVVGSSCRITRPSGASNLNSGGGSSPPAPCQKNCGGLNRNCKLCYRPRYLICRFIPPPHHPLYIFSPSVPLFIIFQFLPLWSCAGSYPSHFRSQSYLFVKQSLKEIAFLLRITQGCKTLSKLFPCHIIISLLTQLNYWLKTSYITEAGIARSLKFLLCVGLPGFDYKQCQEFFFATTCRSALENTEPLTKYVPRSLSSRTKSAGAWSWPFTYI